MRTTILNIQKMKDNGQRIPMITAYDAAGARLVEEAGISMILVGDSLGMTVQGNETTLPVTLDDMIYHTRMVVRGTNKALIVLETIPAQLAKEITARLHIPTIGIGAGPECDGQVQVFHDLLGLTEGKVPKHAKQYAHLADDIRQAVTSYISEVQANEFPTEEHSVQMDETTLAALYGH